MAIGLALWLSKARRNWARSVGPWPTPRFESSGSAKKSRQPNCDASGGAPSDAGALPRVAEIRAARPPPRMRAAAAFDRLTAGGFRSRPGRHGGSR